MIPCDIQLPKHLEAASASSALIAARTMHRKTVPRNLGGKALAARRAPWNVDTSRPWWTATFYGIQKCRKKRQKHPINDHMQMEKFPDSIVINFSTWEDITGQSGTCEMTSSSRFCLANHPKSSFTETRSEKQTVANLVCQQKNWSYKSIHKILPSAPPSY